MIIFSIYLAQSMLLQGNNDILYFPIAHKSPCLAPRFCLNFCFFLNAVGRSAYSQELFTTIVYAKFFLGESRMKINKLMPVFLALVLLLIMNFIVTLSK